MLNRRNLILISIVSLICLYLPGLVLGYYTSGSFTSTNLLSSHALVDNFYYDLSAKPSGTTAVIQFSRDNSNWYNSSGVLGGTNTLSVGTNNVISLSSLDWRGSSFYYKVSFTSDGAATPVLDKIILEYSPINVPTVTTSAATNIGIDSATGNGIISSNGGETVDMRGVQWGTDSGIYTSSSTQSGSFLVGNFTKDMGDLVVETTYYYQAMAHNSAGWGFGEEKSFRTDPPLCEEHNVSGYAWSETIGWVSLSCTNESGVGAGSNYGVDIATSTGVFSGHAWSENIGWIDFGVEGEIYPGTPEYSVQAATDTGEVTGWATTCSVYESGCSGDMKPLEERGGWSGWILMDGDGSTGVNIDYSDGSFSGYAWSDMIIGWMDFQYASTTFNLAENAAPSAGSLDVSGAGECSYVLQIPTFSWTYTDSDNNPVGTDPQSAYQIRIDSDSAFEVDENDDAVLDSNEFTCTGSVCSGGSSASFSPT
ncbi:MAG: hypothetical protein WC302_00665, partial [Candidatus Paceibacterota bacterium]